MARGIEGLAIRAERVLLRGNGQLAHGAPKFMSRARDRVDRLGLVSMHPDLDSSELVRRPGLMGLFDAIRRGREESPDQLSGLCSNLSSSFGVEPANLIVVEASPVGIHAAKEVGCYVVAIAHHFRYHQLKAADARVGSYAQATRHISELAAASRVE